MKIAATLLMGCFASLTQAQGIISITFDGPPLLPPSSGKGITNYYEFGMFFGALQGSPGLARLNVNSESASPGSLFPCNNSAYLQAAFAPAGTLMFNFTNGAVFGLISVDLAEYSTVVPDAVTVKFIGYHPDGSAVTTSFKTDGIIDGTGPLTDFQTFYFNGLGFTDLTRVEIPSYGWSLDNLVVAVPEPASVSLLALGGLVLGAWKWRRKV